MIEVKKGDVWTDGNRIFHVLGVTSLTVVYEDCYETDIVTRLGSRIQWEVDSANGQHWKIGKGEK